MLYDRVDVLSAERQARRLIVFHGSVTAAIRAHEAFPRSSAARRCKATDAQLARRKAIGEALQSLKGMRLCPKTK